MLRPLSFLYFKGGDIPFIYFLYKTTTKLKRHSNRIDTMDAMEYERDLQECVSIYVEEVDTSNETQRIKTSFFLKEAMNKWLKQHEKVCHLLILKLKELEEEEHPPEMIKEAEELFRFEKEEKEKRLSEWS